MLTASVGISASPRWLACCAMGSEFWTGGRTGTLSRKDQAELWALAKVNDEYSLGIKQWQMAKKVTKVGGGHPSQKAVSDLLKAIATDTDWYPGKNIDEQPKGGRPPSFTPQMKQACANAGMALKREGWEPTAQAVIERCPTAAINPKTGFAFADQRFHDVFRTKCFDEGAEQPWGHMVPYHKTALSEDAEKFRFRWAREQEQIGRSEGWFFQQVVSVDPCNTVLSDSHRTGFDEGQASYGKGPRWMSADKRLASRNLRASPYATKQARKGDMRAWWFVVLARGKVGVVFMPKGWRQSGPGVAQFVEQLEDKLREMLGPAERLPRTICSDRGPGLYQNGSGYIVEAYRKAANEAGFHTLAGNDASTQPPDMADFWPHETAVSWIRAFMKKHPLKKGVGLDQMEKDFQATMKEAVRHVNTNYNVDGLCRSFPTRFSELVAAKGGRLKR